MAEDKVTRKLTTILAADVEGYTRLMRADEEATLKTLGEYRGIFDDLIARRDGRVLATALAFALALSGCQVGPMEAGLPQNPEASGHYEKGVRHLDAGELDLAVRELERAVRRERTSGAAQLELGTAYYHAGDYERAVVSLQKSKDLSPEYQRTRYQLAHALYAVKKFHEAAEQYEKVSFIRHRRLSHFEALLKNLDPPFFLQVLSLLRSGEFEIAKTLLSAPAWIGTNKMIADYLLDKSTEEQLLSESHSAEDYVLFVHLVIGVNNIVNNDLAKAEKFLRTVQEKAPPTTLHYSLAKVNLEHIGRGSGKKESLTGD